MFKKHGAVVDNCFVFILAGGSGERFWPMSRADAPKHLIPFFSGKTLLEETIERAKGLVPDDNIYILTNSHQLSLIKRTIPGFPLERIIPEPEKKDTAAAASLAVAMAAKHSEEAVVILLPADSKIENKKAFQHQLRACFVFAKEERRIVAIAIPPRYPATGFGYLKLDKSSYFLKEEEKFFPVVRFVEKPTMEYAQSYVKDGNYGWNAGLFIWSVKTFLDETSRWAPAFHQFILDYLKDPFGWKNKFIGLPRISIDYALMEKTDKIFAIEAKFDWDDLGSWISAASYLESDEKGNKIKGKICAYESEENIVVSNSKLIALCGVKDLVVIESDRAILVCPKDKLQELKKLYSFLPPEFK
ncbi:mannose-1-phosphate guanylyltransferase [Candidatus Methylacidiphilum infernorum]|uniref:Mannose-1-phosphate guanylyltransferase n=1 Tax=Candidatus Methylacidiphilum infernorum TaxID=511746 RepID=A0ABX7PWC0_9BACT|nr:sugar phosphate nucleotidyltransferase [Candidatus Methylacidiphilum infernorum]QSR87305.1 mannose-1-phosphate guanylyltransferase [Candidatus Methylacidiphilum infernorum]